MFISISFEDSTGDIEFKNVNKTRKTSKIQTTAKKVITIVDTFTFLLSK